MEKRLFLEAREIYRSDNRSANGYWGGIGGEILNYAYLQAGNRIIVLNVESLDSTADNREQRKRRIAFYGRHGICETVYGFLSDGVAYSVLTSNLQAFNPDEYAKMLGVELFDMRVDTNL